MAKLVYKVLKSSILIVYILIFVNIGDASVTWRRVFKPTAKNQVTRSKDLQGTTLSLNRTSTKAPITWKRSTIVRRSTDAEENRARTVDSDELNNASSERDEAIRELDTDSEIKPLLPGSRPGFWFDSTRKKKPSSLLRPDTRRNSLFPTRSSTTEDSTTVNVTPAPIIPRTPLEVSNTPVRNVSTRIFGRNRTTKPPISFKRRTTPTPKKTVTTEVAVLDKGEKENEEFETEDLHKNEEEADLGKKLENTDEVDDDLKPKTPKFKIRRRRPYNGTRLSWTKSRIIRTTTVTPQQLTTVSASSSSTDFYTKSFLKTTKFPRTRITKLNSTLASDVVRFRIKQITAKPNVSSTLNTEKSKEIITVSDLGKGNDPNNINKNIVSNSTSSEKNRQQNFAEPYGTRQSSEDHRRPKTRTTIEPFYITKEYGMVATVVPDINNNYESREPMPISILNDEENEATQVREDDHLAEIINSSPKREKKRKKTQATEAPKVLTKFEEKSQNIEKENDYNEENEAQFEYIDNFGLKDTTTESHLTTLIEEEWTEKRLVNQDLQTTTTDRPVTLPVVPSIDSNSNAYVVWSVGPGGSGWSYQKQGGNVKWSAQNSEAEGDSWSVVSKEEEDKVPSYRWTPIRNSVDGYKSSAKTNEKLAHTLKNKGDIPSNVPVTYTPKLTFKNETLSNYKKATDSYSFGYNNSNYSFIDFNSPSKVMYTNNDSSPVSNLPQVVYVQGTQPTNFPSQTQSPFYPTIENQFNAEVDAIINRYPTASNYPYVAEIRETINRPPIAPANIPTTGIYDFQEYVTQHFDPSLQKEPQSQTTIAQNEQFVQNPQKHAYPATFTESELNLLTADAPNNSNRNTYIDDYSTVNARYESYQSSIPPELAKSVVMAKKWRVIGNGGNEGWSLLNEDGLLEWKIHNVDGHWRVTNAEDLAKTQQPLQPTPQDHDSGRSQAELYGYNDPAQNDAPKVWTFEDDYDKWRAVSVEKGIPTDKSSGELSEEDYDYDTEDVQDNYYPNEEYDNFEPINQDHTSYLSNDGNGGRPLWENEKSNHPNRPFSGNIEIANTREDAIAAWKSLIAQQGVWKISDENTERNPQHRLDQMQHIPKITKNTDVRVPTMPEKHDNYARNENSNIHDIINNKYHSSYSPYQGRDSEIHRKDSISPQKQNDKKNEGLTNSEQYNTFRKNYRQNHSFNDKEESNTNPSHDSNDTVYEKYYNTLPATTEQNFDNYKKYYNEKKDNDQNQKFHDQKEALGHYTEYQKQAYDISNRQERLNPEVITYNADSVKQNGNTHYKQHHLHLPTKSNAHMNGKIPEKSTEKIVVLDTRLKNKDHSKLESLINKLEAIQKEAKGRAVIDLTALINQMKARRNLTSSVFDHSKLNVERNNHILAKHNIQENSANVKDTEIQILKNRKSENPEAIAGLRRDIDYKIEKEISKHDPNKPENNNNNNRNIRSQNHESSSYSNKSKRRKRPSSRQQNPRTDRVQINQTSPYHKILNPSVKEHKRDSYKVRNAEGKTAKIFKEVQYKPTLHTQTPQLNLGKSRSDSSSSEEFIVNPRDGEKNKLAVPKRRKRPSQKRSRRPHQPPPIVMKGETEIEDETGSKKSRKIIVIDYAGSKQKKNSVDKKDLELIIRNIKHRRSELREDND